MIESEILQLVNDLLDRCELNEMVLDIINIKTKSTNGSELKTKSHCSVMHDVSCDASKTELLLKETFNQYSQQKCMNSNSDELMLQQNAEGAQSSEIIAKPAGLDESPVVVPENESVSYSPCEGLLFSDSDCSQVITDEIDPKSENLKLSTDERHSLDSVDFDLESNKLIIPTSVFQKDVDVSTVHGQINSSVHVQVESGSMVLCSKQEIKGEKLEINENDLNGCDNKIHLPEEDHTMRITLPDEQNTIKLCTGNSNNKNIDLLGQVKNDYSVKALNEETDCCNITSEIESRTKHREQKDLNQQTDLSDIARIEILETFQLDTYQEVDNVDESDDCTDDSSNLDEVVSKKLSVKIIVDGYLDDIPSDVNNQQIISDAAKSNYLSLFNKSETKMEEITKNVIVSEKQEIEAMYDINKEISTLLESTEKANIKETVAKSGTDTEYLVRYNIDANTGYPEQLLIDSQFNETGCKGGEIDIETKTLEIEHQTDVIFEENKNCFESKFSLENCDKFGRQHLTLLDGEEKNVADQNTKPCLNKVQITLNNESFMKESKVNEKCKRGKTSSETSNCEKNKCAWNNAEWKINDTIVDKESCRRVNKCPDILRSNTDMKFHSAVEKFKKHVDIFHDEDSSILENHFDGNEQVTTLSQDSNLHEMLLVSSPNHLHGESDASILLGVLKSHNAKSDELHNSPEYISCAQEGFQDISQNVISSSKELTTGEEDLQSKSKEIFKDSFKPDKSQLEHFSQIAVKDTSRETKVVRPDFYGSKEVETPDAYIDLDEDFEDFQLYPATQCFKPSIQPSEVIDSRSDLIQTYQSNNMNGFENEDVTVPDINHKRNISQLYSRNPDASEIKKSRKENPCFEWIQSMSTSTDIKGEEVINMKPLVTCSRPIRLGLSKKQKIKTLHKN